jgi:hypothetical protein
MLIKNVAKLMPKGSKLYVRVYYSNYDMWRQSKNYTQYIINDVSEIDTFAFQDKLVRRIKTYKGQIMLYTVE